MSHRLLQRIRRTVAQHDLLPRGSRVVAGVSGGSDSVALACLLIELSEHAGFTVAGLAHLNHRLRDTAERDEQASRALAATLQQPIVVERIDVRGYAGRERLSLEDAARRVRYDFLDRAAERLDADRIAVGHTQDDQAETFLLRLIRGAGGTGLGGIYRRRGRVIRPLLDVPRADLRTWLTSRGVEWVEDESNEDLSNPRNRIRHVIIPELERAAGGSVRGAIARAAELVRDDAAWLEDAARGRFEALGEPTSGGMEIDAEALAGEPSPVRRRVLLLALRHIAGDRQVGLEHVRTAAAVLAGACGGTDVPGGRVELRRGKLVLSKQGPPVSDTLIES